MQVSATTLRAFDTTASVRIASDRAARRDAMLTRAIDVTVAFMAVLLLLPLLLVIVVALKLTSPGPILFAHRRIGKGGQVFPCYKFRSMIVNSAEVLERHLAECPEAHAEWLRDQKLRNDPRITPLGRILRETSLDELPQLFNVLRGDMSLVGPRPIVDEEAFRYAHRFAAYKRVRPGLTGLWQVSGRSDASYAARVKFDTVYVRSWSLPLDIAILLRTVRVVLKREGSC